MTIEMKPLSKVEVAKKSAWKAVVTALAMSLGVAVLGAAADFLGDAGVLSGIFSADPKLLVLVPIFAMAGQALKDWIKHVQL